jgi:ketosteroid isomerase-like protein
MSQENAEVVRKLFAALGREDFPAALQLFDRGVLWSTTEGGEYHGIEGVTDSYVEWMEPWKEHDLEAEEFIDCGDDRVLAVIQITARGEHSGIEIDQRFFHLYTVREGKISRMIEYVDRASALEAAGAKD